MVCLATPPLLIIEVRARETQTADACDVNASTLAARCAIAACHMCVTQQECAPRRCCSLKQLPSRNKRKTREGEGGMEKEGRGSRRGGERGDRRARARERGRAPAHAPGRPNRAQLVPVPGTARGPFRTPQIFTVYSRALKAPSCRAAVSLLEGAGFAGPHDRKNPSSTTDSLPTLRGVGERRLVKQCSNGGEWRVLHAGARPATLSFVAPPHKRHSPPLARHSQRSHAIPILRRTPSRTSAPQT